MRPGLWLVLLWSALRVLADGDSGQSIRVPSVLQHRELTVDVTETEIEGLEEQDDAAERLDATCCHGSDAVLVADDEEPGRLSCSRELRCRLSGVRFDDNRISRHEPRAV